MFSSFKTGLEPIFEKLGLAMVNPHVPPPSGAAMALKAPAAAAPGFMRRNALPLAAGGLGLAAAGVGAAGLLHQHEQDQKQYHQVSAPMTGSYY